MLRHRTRWTATFLALSVLALLPACSDDPTGSAGNPLLGTWNITSFSAFNQDLIQLGMTLSITLESDGTYVISVENDLAGVCDGEPGDDCELDGDYESTSTTLTFDPEDENPSMFDYMISGSMLTLTGMIEELPVTITGTKQG